MTHAKAAGSLLKTPKAAARGITLMILCTLFFAVMDGVSKLLIVDYPVGEILFVRYVFFLILVLAVTRPGRLRQTLKVRRPLFQISRAALLVADQVVFILALSFLALADAHILMSSAPLLVTALSIPFLGEKVGIRRWMAIGLGFLGVVLVLRPGGDLFQPAALLPLAAAVLFAVYQIMTRMVSAYDSTRSTVLYNALVGTVAFAILAPFDWTTPDAGGWMLLAVLAVLGGTAHVLLIKALEMAPASVLQPFFYMTLAWSVMVGYLFFGALPSAMTIVGAAIIVGAGLYTFHRERRLSRLEQT